MVEQFNLRRLWRRAHALFGIAYRAAPGLAIWTTLLSLTAGLLGVIYPIGFRVLVDGTTAHNGRRVIVGVVVIGVSVGASWGARVAGAMSASRLTDATNLSLGLRIGQLVNAAPYLEHFERPEHLAEIDNLRAQRRTLAGGPRQLLSLLQTAVQVIAVIVLIALVYPPVLLVPVLAIAPGLADRRASKIQKRSADDLADGSRLLGDLFTLASTASPARELRTFGVTGAVLERHAELSTKVNRQALAAARRSALWEASGWAVYALGFAAGIIVLVLRAAHGDTSPGAVVEAVSLIRRSQRQLGSATDTAGSFMTANTTAGRLIWLEDYVAQSKATANAPIPDRIEDGITLSGVAFTYPGQAAQALRDVDLHLPAGSTVAIVGENGAGKSTLIKLLLGMYRPSRGKITLDGLDLATVDVTQWRAMATGAFQDFVRYNMTMSDGVGLGDLPRIDEREEVGRAVGHAGATDLVERLPQGFDTLLGAYVGGRSLSGGEWQRLALARGFMRDRPLLIVLDEPTASLDAPTEAALFARYHEAARRLGAANGAITVLVSHRFSTVHVADKIVVLEDATVAEQGTHAELMARGGTYAQLYELQARGYRSSLNS